MHRVIITALFCLGLLFPAGASADSASEHTRWLQDTVNALALDIEMLAAQTRPAEWEMLHSCIYYPLAGQYLLAWQGVVTRLEAGSILYDPQTPLRHGIDPHIWLESPTHLIDCANLPRRGEVSVIPMSLVARHDSEVVPGVTRVLIVDRYRYPEYLAYLAGHRNRFAGILRTRGLPANWVTPLPCGP